MCWVCVIPEKAFTSSIPQMVEYHCKSTRLIKSLNEVPCNWQAQSPRGHLFNSHLIKRSVLRVGGDPTMSLHVASVATIPSTWKSLRALEPITVGGSSLFLLACQPKPQAHLAFMLMSRMYLFSIIWKARSNRYYKCLIKCVRNTVFHICIQSKDGYEHI